MNLIDKLKINTRLFKVKFSEGFLNLYSILGFITIFFTSEKLGLNNSMMKFLLCLLFICFIAIFQVFVFKEKIISKKGEHELHLLYGDIIKYGFDETDKKKIIVINVNTAFDTMVEKPNVIKPLVSDETKHGKWIEKMLSIGIKKDDLDNNISKSLNSFDYQWKIDKNKQKGKNNIYPKGTIAVYEFKSNTFFYLLAFSEFDDSNTAQNTKSEMINTLISLIQFYKKNGQGLPMYVPLMGTGKSNTNIDDDEALEIIVSAFKLYKDDLKGKIYIVVDEKLQDRISIDI